MDTGAGAERGCSVSSLMSWLGPLHVVKGPGKKKINKSETSFRPVLSDLKWNVQNEQSLKGLGMSLLCLGWQTPTVELIRINQLVRDHDPYSGWPQAQNIYMIHIYQNNILKIFIECLTRPEFVSRLLCVSESSWRQTSDSWHQLPVRWRGENTLPMMTWNLNLNNFAYQIQTTS